MSEPTKPRFTVDLEEIDRQLRRSATSAFPRGETVAEGAVPGQAGTPASYPPVDVRPPQQRQPDMRPMAPMAAGQGGGDPLQELARIVGQEDPFQSILGAAGGAPRRQPAQDASPFAPSYGDVSFSPKPAAPPQPAIGNSPEVGNLSEYLRSESERATRTAASPSYQPYSRHLDSGAEDLDALAAAQQKAPGHTGELAQGGAENAAYAPAGDYASSAHSYDSGYTPSYADPKLGFQPGYDDTADEEYIPPRSSRRKLFLAGGVAILAVVMGTVGYSFMRSKGIIGGGEPPLVTASSEPTKVAPEVPGGKEFPDQNKQIYQNNATEGSTQVVNREEQPLDIREATGARNELSSSSAFGEARKVRTIVIRPDGTPLTSPAAPQPAGQAANGGSPFPVTASANPAAASVQAPSASPAPSTPPAAQTAQPARPPQAAQPAATPPQRPAAATSGGAQQAAANPAPAARPTPQPEASAPAPGGAYVVQFGVAGSEAEGRTRFSRLKGQHPDILGNVSLAIRAAEVNGRTVYRIRTSGMSRDASDTLCSNLKAAGGDCFVVRN